MNKKEALLAFDRALTQKSTFDLDLAAGRALDLLRATEQEDSPVGPEFVQMLETILTSSLNKTTPLAAAPLFERLLHLFERTVSPNCPQVAAVLYALGEIYAAQRISPFEESDIDHFRPALLAYKRSLALIRAGGTQEYPYPSSNKLLERLNEVSSHTSHHVNHCGVADGEDLVGLYQQAKDFLHQGAIGDAEWLLKRIIVAALTNSEKQIHLLASCFHLLAQMHSSRQRYLEAERIYAHCWQLLEGKVNNGVISPADLDENEATPLDEIMADWAKLYEQMGVYRKARACWRRAIDFAKERGALATVGTIRNMLALARNYVTVERTEDALERYLSTIEAMFGLGVFIDDGRVIYISPAGRKEEPKTVISLAIEVFLEAASCYSDLDLDKLALETVRAVIPFARDENLENAFLTALFNGVKLSVKAGKRGEALTLLEEAQKLNWDYHHEIACSTAKVLLLASIPEPAQSIYLRVISSYRLDDSRIDFRRSLSQSKAFIGLALISKKQNDGKNSRLYAGQAKAILEGLPRKVGLDERLMLETLL